MKYSSLTAKNPDYQAQYWAECRALYRGGESLLRDKATMARLFPRHGAEEPEVYAERMARAEYVNYAGSVIDYIVAALCAEPLTMRSEPKADPFFEEFAKSTDGKGMTLLDLLQEQTLTALQVRRAWTLVDLPPRDDGAVIESESDEEEIDQLRALAFPIEPECVLDWDCDPSGTLEWALLCMRTTPRASLSDSRSTTVESFTYYTRTNWERYEVRWENGKKPKANDDITRTGAGVHSFGAVPLARLELPLGLWAMDRIHCLARSHLNKRSATSWSEYRHLFPILGAYLAPEMGSAGEIPSEVAQDPNRAKTQVYGIGRIVQFGNKDELRYTSPDAMIYDTALRDLDGLRDEIHRVLHHMALAANNSSAALGRSGKSKAQDKAATAVVLAHLGELLRRHAKEVFDLARRGRRDPETTWSASGMESFENADVAEVIQNATLVDMLKIPSETFQRLRIFANARRILGPSATPDQLEAIRKELERNVSAEEFAGNLPPTPGTPYAENPDDEPDGDESEVHEEPDEADDGDEPKQPKRQASV